VWQFYRQAAGGSREWPSIRHYPRAFAFYSYDTNPAHALGKGHTLGNSREPLAAYMQNCRTTKRLPSRRVFRDVPARSRRSRSFPALIQAPLPALVRAIRNLLLSHTHLPCEGWT
jgi:hypothetical protein